MRHAAALALCLGLLPTAAARQDAASLEEVLAMMEKRAEGLQDASWRVELQADRAWGLPGTAAISVSYVKGAGLRLRAISEGNPDLPFNVMPATFDVVYATDALYVIQEFSPAGAPAAAMPGMTMPEMPVTLQAFRLKYADPAAGGRDLQVFPLGFPIRIMFDDPFVYYQIAPRFFLGREPNLSYAGMKPVGETSCHVLRSTPSAADQKEPKPAFRLETNQKEFFIDPKTGALLCVRWELTTFSPRGAGAAEERIIFSSDPVGSRKVTAALSLPESVRWTIEQGGRRRENTQRMTRVLHDLRVNTGAAPETVLSAAEKDDLYADLLPRPAADYEARIAKDPKDAEAHYSLAFARGVLDFWSLMNRMPRGAEKPDYGPVARSIEKAAALRPAAEGAVLNLLSVYKAAGEPEAEKALLERIVNGEIKGDRVRFRAATRLNASGDHGRAGKLLETLKPVAEPERRRVALERLFTAAAGGDEAGLRKLFADEAAARTSTAEKASLVDALEGRLQSLPEAAKQKFPPAKLLEIADQGMKENPGEPAWALAKASLRLAEGGGVAAALVLLEAAPQDETMVSRAMEALFPNTANRMVMRGRAAAPPKDWEAEESARLAAALSKVRSEHPVVGLALGRALSIGGKAEESKKSLVAALEACKTQPAGKPHHAAALRAAFLLGAEKGPENWIEQCAEVILTIGKGSSALPYDLLYDEVRNPMSVLAAEAVGRKDWMKYYALACRANQAFKNWYTLRVNGPIPKEAYEAIRAAVAKEADGAKFVELADFLENSAGDGRSHLEETLEKAAEKLPEDVELRLRLARVYAQGASRDKAIAAFETALPKLPAARQLAAKVEMMELLVARAPEKVREVLATVDAAALTSDHAQRVVELCLQAKDWDRGIAACAKAFELGLQPNLQMGIFQEKKENYIEAIRYYNRDRASADKNDPEAQMRKMQREARVRVRNPRGGAKDPEEGEPETGEAARTRLLKKLGADYLLNRFLAQKFAPLSEADEKSLKAALEKLSSDESRERDAGYDEIKKAGSKAAPLLRPLLQSSEPELQARVRQLLVEWSEPR